jgi:DNA-binding response OmpR family regulator
MSSMNQTNSLLIAVIEDEAHLAQGLLFNLEAEGYRVHHEVDGEAALQWLLHATGPDATDRPAAVLLDVMLPSRNGFSIVKELRDAQRFTPVLLLTARGRSEDIVEGFAAGADDYLPKPFDLGVLFARLTALLRRVHWQVPSSPGSTHPRLTEIEAAKETYQIGLQTVDLDALEIRSSISSEEPVRLTLMEADLLRYLLDHPNRIIPRKELLENVWHLKEDTDTRAIDNFIVRLRRYIEPDPVHPVYLLTVRGVGYRFVAEA